MTAPSTWGELTRNAAKDTRKRLWRAIRRVQEVDRDHPAYEGRLRELQLWLSVALLDTGPAIEVRADREKWANALWHTAQIGDRHGLDTAEQIVRSADGDLLDPDLLLATATALNNGAILAFDLPPRAPVFVGGDADE